MSRLEDYSPGPADMARVEKTGSKWVLVLVKELRHPPEKVWEALTDPAHLREWAPFDADGSLGKAGAIVNLTWGGTNATTQARVTRADAPTVLEFGDIRWELEAVDHGTRLTLWHTIARPYIAMGATGWHISIDVLDRLLGGQPIGRISGADAIEFEGWQRLNAEYAKKFGVETPKWVNSPKKE